jgi:iron complex outermembrane receptor protein
MHARSLAIGSLAFVTAVPAFASDPPALLEVEVRGTPAAPPPKDTALAGSVIHADRLSGPGLSAADVLRTQPGVSVTDTGGFGGPSTASIRGATAAETPIYLGGVRLNDDVGGTADLSLVPLWMLDRIEVYRSGAPIEADQLGIGGAIFFEPRFPRATEASVGVTTGSFGKRGIFGHAGVGGERAGVLFGGQYDGAENDYSFIDDQGTRFVTSDDRSVRRTNADVRTLNLWALGQARFRADGSVKAFANHVERTQGLPGLTLFPSQAARGDLRRDLGAVTSQVPCARDGSCKIMASTSLLASDSTLDDPRRELALGTTRLDFRAARVEQMLALSLGIADRVTLVPTVRAAVENLSIDTLDAANLRAQRLFSRVAVGGRWLAAEGVEVHGLVSGECHGTSASGRVPWSLAGQRAPDTSPCGEFEPAGRASLELGGPALKFLTNVGRYVRVPTLTELYGSTSAVRGNPNLVPETGVMVDAGVRTYGSATGADILEGSYLDVFGFVRFADELIAYRRASVGYVTPFNVGSARIAGLELLAGIRPLRWLLFELSGTLLDPRNTSQDRPTNDLLPYQARLVAAPRIEANFRRPVRGIDRVKLDAIYFFESERYADPAGLVVIPAQQSLDLEAELAVLAEHLSMRVRLANVLDQERMDLIGYPLPGRAAYLSLEAKW